MATSKFSSFFGDENPASKLRTQRALAQNLMQQGQQQDPNQEVSGIVVKQNPLSQIARALTSGVGGYLSADADNTEQDMQTQRAQKLGSAISQYPTDPNAAVQSLVSDPSTADAGMQLFSSKLNSDNMAQKESADLQRQIAVANLRNNNGAGVAPPAAVALANEITNARKNGDMQRVQDLMNSAKINNGFNTDPLPPPAQLPPAPGSQPPVTPPVQPTASPQPTQSPVFNQANPPVSVAPSTPAPAAPAQSAPLTGDAYYNQLAKSNPSYAAGIKALSNNDIDIGTLAKGRKLTPEIQAKIINDVQSINPDWNQRQYKAIQDFTNGKHGDTLRSIGVTRNHIATFNQLVDALNNGDSQLINKLGNEFSEQTGSPAPTNLQEAGQILADESIKGIIGSGAAQGDREGIAANLRNSKSADQLKGASGTLDKLMEGQQNGIKAQYSSNGLKDFDKRFSAMVNKSSPQSSVSSSPKEGDTVAGTLNGKPVTLVSRNGKWVPQ